MEFSLVPVYEREREREREFIQGDIVLLQTHSDNTATVEQKFTKCANVHCFSHTF